MHFHILDVLLFLTMRKPVKYLRRYKTYTADSRASPVVYLMPVNSIVQERIARNGSKRFVLSFSKSKSV